MFDPRLIVINRDRVHVTHPTHAVIQPDRVVEQAEISPGNRYGDVIRENERVKAIEDAIDSIWATSGFPAGTQHGGLVQVGDGYYREYAGGGRIYVTFSSPIGFGRLTWRGFLVNGDIGEKYTQLGGPQSWLGWPTSGEQNFDQGGRVSTFQNGAIYWWPDTGAIELGSIAVRYTGLVCFGETDSDQLSNSDEPYIIFGVVPTVPGMAAAPRTGVYEDVDAGEARGDLIELYRGLPYGLSLSIVLMEHDFGDPNKYRDQVKQGVDAASVAVSAALGAIPVVGPFLGAGAATALAEAEPYIVDAVNDVLDTDDDHINTVSMIVTPKDMVKLTRAEHQNIKGVLWQMELPLISGDGASYKAYFDIQAV